MNESGSDGVMQWSKDQVVEWAQQENLSKVVIECIRFEEIDGKTLLTLSENDLKDLRDKCNYRLKIGDIKRFWIAVRTLQKDNLSTLICMGLTDCLQPTTSSSGTGAGTTVYPLVGHLGPYHHHHHHHHGIGGISTSDFMHLHDIERISPPLSVDGRATSVPPEVFKTVISLGYSFLVTWITAFVMVVVHERVPDMKRYPPLPDIFLDNVPHIPWAFHMCEITGTVLFAIWSCVCIFHKYRLVLLRRFFALAGTVFLLRCVTMLITSLSVPGTHLQCNPNDYKVDDINLSLGEALELRISRAYTIWSGLGMSIQGVRTCGDYMFSGHTVALTLLNFFITEYTPRNLYFLHTMTWLLNMFGIFFILAAHEHYSIDVFVAFYITSRLFLYYHTLANNQALMSHDSNRTRIWFPMFSYFESSVDGIIPNEYDSIYDILSNIFSWITCIKDSFMLTARRIWIVPPNLPPLPKAFIPRPSTPKKIPNSTSTTTAATTTSETTINSNNNDNVTSTTSTVTTHQVTNSNNQNLTITSKSIATTSNPAVAAVVVADSLTKNLNNSVVNNMSPKFTQKPLKSSNFIIFNNDIRDENFKNNDIDLNMKKEN